MSEVYVTKKLDRASDLLYVIANATKDEREKGFRVIAAWFVEKKAEAQIVLKGFSNYAEAKQFFKQQGIEEGWYLIHDRGDATTVIL